MNKGLNIKSWEPDTFFDTSIIGGGIFGLSMGCTILENDPTKSICILERGILPQGATSRNAGMGSFIGFAEFLDEIDHNGLERATEKMLDRYHGLQILVNRFKNDPLIIQQKGCYDIIYEKDLPMLNRIGEINNHLRKWFPHDIFQLKNERISELGMNSQLVKALVHNSIEWQINSGRLLVNLIKHFQSMGGRYLTGCEVLSHSYLDKINSHQSQSDSLSKNQKTIKLTIKHPFVENETQLVFCKTAIFCVNGFAQTFFAETKISPERGQVMITKPIKSLNFESNFFADLGFYYMRTVNGRILLGGARHLNFEQEKTSEFYTPQFYKDHLPQKLREFFPALEFEVDFFWSGIMGFQKGDEAYSIQKISDGLYSVFGCFGSGMSMVSFVTKKAYDIIFTCKPKL